MGDETNGRLIWYVSVEEGELEKRRLEGILRYFSA